MSNFKFTLNRAGVRELLQCGEMQGIVEEKARGVLSRAGVGFSMNSRVGKTRVNAMVYPETKEAYFRNLHGNILLKALR
ncbi:hypothetical protein [uncultured Peptoniphilus sp.]|uniref:hypothetical protein n=1 Tax=uncultured Peptoniphilus sp. TaxID=254354 RepID=UPI0028048AD8|nr:hypothetical protein [uncultured Peptoniphilus sp.]